MADLPVLTVYYRPPGDPATDLVAVLEGGLAYQVLPEDESQSAQDARALVESIEAGGGTVPIFDDSADPPTPPPLPPPGSVPEQYVTWGELVEVAERAEAIGLPAALREFIAELEASG